MTELENYHYQITKLARRLRVKEGNRFPWWLAWLLPVRICDYYSCPACGGPCKLDYYRNSMTCSWCRQTFNVNRWSTR